MYGMGRNMFGMQNNQTGQQQGTIRTQMRLGFAQPIPASTQVTAQFGRTVTRVLERQDIGGGQVNVAMEGRTAVLTGTVGSSHAREVVERLALLEPGISEVRNELTVSPEATTPETVPTPNSGDQPR